MDDPAEFSANGCLLGLFQLFVATLLWRWAAQADQEWSADIAAATAADDERFQRLLDAFREGQGAR